MTEDIDYELDRLMEELTLDRQVVPAESPPAYGYNGGWQHRYSVAGVDYIYKNAAGNKHRLYGPAYISERYRITEWCKDGEYHRIGGPAVQHKNIQLWFVDGKKHRLDGPAVISKGGPKEYWINGQKLSPKEYKKEIARRIRKGLIK